MIRLSAGRRLQKGNGVIWKIKTRTTTEYEDRDNYVTLTLESEKGSLKYLSEEEVYNFFTHYTYAGKKISIKDS